MKIESSSPRRLDLTWIEEVAFALGMCAIVNHFWNLRPFLILPLCGAFHLAQVTLWKRKELPKMVCLAVAVFCLEIISVDLFRDYVATSFAFLGGGLALCRSDRLTPIAVGLMGFTIFQGSGLHFSLENWWLTNGAFGLTKTGGAISPLSDFLGPVPIVLLCLSIWLSVEQRKSFVAATLTVLSFVVLPVIVATIFQSYWFAVAALAALLAPPRRQTSLAQDSDKGSSNRRKRTLAIGAIMAMLAIYGGQMWTKAGEAPKRIVFSKIGLGSIDPDLGPPLSNQIPLEATFRMLPVLLRSQGCSVETSADLTQSNLQNTDLLVVINPTKEFSKEQSDLIMQRLREGMTVLVAGDHTNMMEVGKGCNSILGSTGIRLAFDSAIPGENFPGWRHAMWQRSDLQKGTDSGNSLAISVGASLQIDSTARPLIVGVHGFSDKANFAVTPGHLGNMIHDRGEREEDLILAADQQIGKGRLIVFGDTSPLQDGALTTSADAIWKLMRLSPTTLSVSPWVIIATLILVIVAISATSTKKQVIGLALAGFVIGTVVFWLDKDTTPLKIHDDAVVVSDHAPVYPGVYSEEYLGKFFWLLTRKGIPCVSTTLAEAIRQNPKKIILAGPRLPLSSREGDELDSYVRAGGDLLIFQDWKDRIATKDFLARQGLELSNQPLGGKSYSSIVDPITLAKMPKDVSSSKEDTVIDATPILGTIEPIVKTYDQTTFGMKKVGQGRIIISSDARWISDEVLGTQTQLDLKAARLLYEIL